MAGERPGHILQATALVNEAYMRLVDWKDVPLAEPRPLLRHGGADHAPRPRRRGADARPRQARRRPVARLAVGGRARARRADSVDLVALDDALSSLEALDARQSRVVELRFFGGLSLEETAHVLDVSVGTVRRDWSLARAWLFRELSGEP